MIRRVKVRTLHDRYGKANVQRDIGKMYCVTLWHEQLHTAAGEVNVTETEDFEVEIILKTRAAIIKVAVEADVANAGIIMLKFVLWTVLGLALMSFMYK